MEKDCQFQKSNFERNGAGKAFYDWCSQGCIIEWPHICKATAVKKPLIQTASVKA